MIADALATGHSIQQWLERCFAAVGKDWRAHVRARDEFVPEYKRLICDPTTMHGLGWHPTVSFGELAEMMIGSK